MKDTLKCVFLIFFNFRIGLEIFITQVVANIIIKYLLIKETT